MDRRSNGKGNIRTKKTVERGKGMTNGEMIRNMSDEEFAVTIMCPNETGHAEIECNHEDWRNCCRCSLDWIRKESEE